MDTLLNNDKAALSDLSTVQNFYQGKRVFLTGCTGAVGEVCLEKFLRCQVKVIYLLCRSKRGIAAIDRMKTICSSALFSKLRELDKNFFDRIQFIDGDINVTGLGISPTDRIELLNNVDMVVHLAADVRFDSPLHEICLTNVRGTREILNMAKHMKQLIAFTYVSTTYSHCCRSRVKERFYPAPIDPEQMINLAESFADDPTVLNALCDKFIAPWPNTYTFSKAVSEELVRLAENDLPIVVIRPSIVTVTNEDPIAGWGTNFYGLNGVLAAVGAGLLRVMNMKKDLRTNLTCTDFVVNGIMLAMFEMCQRNDKMWQLKNDTSNSIVPAKVFNISVEKTEITQGCVASSMLARQSKIPFGSAIWYPRSTFCTSTILVPVYNLLYQFLPAIFFDVFLRVSKSEKRLLPITRKIALFSQKTSYFNQAERVFDNNHIKELNDKLTMQDRKNFPCDLEGFDWTVFSQKYLYGMLAYVLKDEMDPKSVANAQRKFFKLKIAHYSFLTAWNGALLALAISYGIYLPILLSVINGIYHRNGV